MNNLRKFLSSFQGITLLIVLVTCLPFLGLGVYDAATTQQQLATFTNAQGVVVDNYYTTTENEGVTSGAYYPVVQFAPNGDDKVRFTDQVGSLPADYNVGDKVSVLYNPQNFKEARINTWWRLWFIPSVMIGIGALPLIVLIIGWGSQFAKTLAPTRP